MLFRSGNIVYLYGVDHIVEKIHFVGKNNSYCIDYTGTKQELPAIFYDYGYFMAISAENMNDDRYDIYISCFNKLYNLECYFEIQNSGGK